MTVQTARLSNIEKLERKLTEKASSIIPRGTQVSFLDLFAIGAVNRTLAQSRGFRSLIVTKNFPSAAILLRTQIDTLMRVNGLRYLNEPEVQLREIFEGKKIFRQLVSWQKTANDKPKYMQDAFLMERLSEEFNWIEPIYKKTSDFVHLSFQHLFTATQSTDDEKHVVNFSIDGEDNSRNSTDYDEICDAFFRVSKLTCVTILGLLMARRKPNLPEDK